MPLKLNSTSGGSVTLQEPSTASNVTFNLPSENSTAIYSNASGNVGIGTSSPDTRLSVYVSGGTSQFRLGNSTSYFWDISRDNVSTGNLSFKNYNADTLTERVRIDTSGNLLVTNPAGLGYGTGSGGTVTQATSKSTDVTLNKPTGQITMAASALAANTSVQFVVNNSLVAITDVAVVGMSAGAASYQNYLVQANIEVGKIVIHVRNISGGSRSEALVINFAIIKGATS